MTHNRSARLHATRPSPLRLLLRLPLPLLLLPLLFPITAFTQDRAVSEHDWESAPKLHPEAHTTDPMVLALHHTVTDWEVENDALVEYYLMHQIRAINTEGAVEDNNKVYVSLSGVESVVTRKARVITPTGKVVELDDEAFKEAEDEDDHERYLYFAFEGLEPGSEIEYIVVLKQGSSMRGDSELMRLGSPVKKRVFELVTPGHLVVGTKSYNGAPEMVLDSTREDVRHLRAEALNVEAMPDEPSAAVGAHTPRIIFKLDRNTGTGARDFSSYVTATKFYWAAVYAAWDAKQTKELKKVIKDMDLSFARDEEDKIRMVENYLKTRYQVLDIGAPQLNDPAFMLENKACNHLGILSLFCNVLNELGVDHQIAITCDRQRLAFDREFEAFNFLDENFIYLPGMKKYIAPAENSLRLGFIPSEYTDQDALFIRTVDVGGVKSGIGKVGHIDPVAWDATRHDMYVNVDLAKENGLATIGFKNEMTGYYADVVQCFYKLMDAEQQTELMDGMIGFVTQDSEEKTVTVSNDDPLKFGVDPLLIEANVTTRKFNETAGEKMLFKVGELIGPQVEMYAEKKRTLPVDDNYGRRFYREITLTLPAGMKVENLDALVFDKTLQRNGETLLQFKSSYTLEGTTLKITVDEFYKLSKLPLEEFETYKAVVNAAADFNKVKLVLAKG